MDNSVVRVKILILGSKGVGKTALVQRLTQDSFPTKHYPTQGAEFYNFGLEVGGDADLLCHIVDTGTVVDNQEYLLSLQYKTNIVQILFEQFRPESFENVRRTVSILNNQKMLNDLDVPLELVVIMTKSDITLSNSQEITHEQARKFCEEQSINKYFQCSSKQGNGNVCEKINKIVIAHQTENYPHQKLTSTIKKMETTLREKQKQDEQSEHLKKLPKKDEQGSGCVILQLAID